MSSQPIATAVPGDDQRTLSLLVSATADLLSVPELERVVERVLAISRHLLAADAYAVWQLIDEKWRILHAAGISKEYKAQSIETASGSQSKITQPFIVEDLETVDAIRARIPLYRTEGIESLMVFPLDERRGVIGTVAFYFRKPRKFSAEEIELGAALTTIITSAIQNAEIYEEQVRLRQQAEQEQKRWSFLAEATALLNSSLDYEATLQRVAQAAVPGIADWCAVSMSTDNGIDTVAVWHSDPKQLELARELHRLYPPHKRPSSPIPQVIQTGKTLYIPEVTEEVIVAAAQDERHLKMIRSLGIRSLVLAPIRSRATNIGTLTLVTAESARQITPADVELAENLANRAAAAIENARLYRQIEKELRTRIEAQAALQKAEERLRDAQSAAKLGAYEWNVRSGKVTWSPEVPSLAGLVPDGDVNKWRSHIHPDDLRAMDDKVRTMDPTGDIELEYRIVKPDGKIIWLLSRGKRVLNAQGEHTHSVGVAIDVTDRKLAENAFQRAEKLAAAGRLAATIAHEINNPLEAVTNLIFLARSSKHLDEQTREFLRGADEELARVAHLTKQTLGFYREQGAPELVDLGALAREVLQLYGGRLRSKSIDLRLELNRVNGTRAVKGELRQIVSNLLANAIDACNAGDAIYLRVRTIGNGSGSRNCLTIGDTGSGISREDQRRLFEPFFTTKKDLGTGLGLWVSRQLAQKNQGTLQFRSSTAKHRSGTVFRLSLPVEA